MQSQTTLLSSIPERSIRDSYIAALLIACISIKWLYSIVFVFVLVVIFLSFSVFLFRFLFVCLFFLFTLSVLCRMKTSNKINKLQKNKTKPEMIITKREDVTMQGSCKILWNKRIRLRGSLLLVLIQSFFCVGGGRGVGVSGLLSLSGKGRAVGWGWALINFFCL